MAFVYLQIDMDILDKNCTAWIKELTDKNTTTEDMNIQFRKRNMTGIIFISLLIVLGIIGNLLVIFIFAWKFNRSTYRVYVLCLAFLDSVNCCFTMPFVLSYLLFMQDYPSTVLCKVGHFVGFYIGIASPFTLILIAVDRYKNVCRPLSVQWSVKKAKLSCIIINVIALMISWHVPFIYGISEIKSANGGITVTQCFKEDGVLLQEVAWWQYIILTVLMVIVSGCLIVTYFVIMIRVHRMSTIFTKYTPENRSLEKSAAFATRNIQTTKTTLTFFIITTVYALSSLIHHGLALALHVGSNLECSMTYAQGVVFWTLFWTIFINNIANPVIYGLSDKRFRQRLKTLFSS